MHAGIAPPWRPAARHAGMPPAVHAGIAPPREQNSWHTLVKILPCPKLRLRAVNITFPFRSENIQHVKKLHRDKFHCYISGENGISIPKNTTSCVQGVYGFCKCYLLFPALHQLSLASFAQLTSIILNPEVNLIIPGLNLVAHYCRQLPESNRYLIRVSLHVWLAIRQYNRVFPFQNFVELMKFDEFHL